jgi:hypothetical protein
MHPQRHAGIDIVTAILAHRERVYPPPGLATRRGGVGRHETGRQKTLSGSTLSMTLPTIRRRIRSGKADNYVDNYRSRVSRIVAAKAKGKT